MRGSLCVTCLTGLLVFSWPTSSPDASDGPMLLGRINEKIEFSEVYPGGEPITGQHFALTFQTSALLPNPDPSAWPYTYCIGCDLELPLGWTGVIDFVDGPSYHQFLSNLSNGINDGSLWQLQVLTRSGRLATAFGSVADEYDWFEPRSAVDEWQVAFVRLRVVRNELSLDNDIALAEGAYRAIWEFWGTSQ